MNKGPQKNKALAGVAWSAVERFSVQGVQFLVSVLLARLLTPDDFGLIAIVLVFSTIFQTINESGINTALIHKLDRDDLDYSTAFYSNLIIGVVSYILLFFLAPLLSDFYHKAELVPVMRVLSVNLIINAVGLVPVAIYTIRVDFKTQARASLVAAIMSGILGVVFAYIFRNVYAIVIQQLSFSAFYVSLMWLFSKWRPLFAFSTSRFSTIFNYAYKLILARVISVVFDDVYSLAIGKLYTPSSLGCYNRAMSFRQMLSKNLINIVQRVSVPLLCEQQKDYASMRQVLLRFMSNTAIMVYPLLTGLMALSTPLVIVVLGEKWRYTADMLLLGCPVGFFYLVSTFNRNVYNATGRTDLALKSEIVKKMFFVLVFLLTMNRGIEPLLFGLIGISIIEMIVDVSLTKYQIGIRFVDEIKSLSGIALASFVMFFCITIVIQYFESYMTQLIAGIFVGVLSYVSICLILNINQSRLYIKRYVQKLG